MALIFSNIQNMMQFISMSQILVWLVEIMCRELLQMNFTFIFVCTIMKLNILWDAIMLLIFIFDSVYRYEIVKNFVSILISLVKVARKSLLKYFLTISFSETLCFHRKDEHFVMKIWTVNKYLQNPAILTNTIWDILPHKSRTIHSTEIYLLPTNTYGPDLLNALYYIHVPKTIFTQFQKNRVPFFFTQSLRKQG